ncbi:DUF3343 domain-containing protein [Helicobacter sp. MIT 21-1697]|uniref:putative Se/S carrier-like protein n=1 Tax=Helicobacter sp. MIT 21-1697 TaxID=2993733 RepID=UPI00224B1614|nr:putative Se/S carrier-like protein [Helicobacter sp. MIT 21-1697]MCX2717569.1 DUF3343 domain-containing protein [Helicobacter sp. MIT 21-1697]
MQQDVKPFRAYIVLYTTSSAFAAQRCLSTPLLASFEFSLSLVPTPKEYSSDCGLALFLEGGNTLQGKSLEDFLESVNHILTQRHMKYEVKLI